MNKRLKIQCWNCPRPYFESIDTTQEELIVKCPYCGAQGKVNLRPYGKQPQKGTVYRGENKDTQNDEEFQFPDVLPTRKSE
jgi:DNA-directed RNA polymerase subunit RPC12/RpoP